MIRHFGAWCQMKGKEPIPREKNRLLPLLNECCFTLRVKATCRGKRDWP